VRALTRARQWAKTRRPRARIELLHEYGRWYAVATGPHVSAIVGIRGGTIVAVGKTPGEAIRECGELLEAMEQTHQLDTTSGDW
jgi:hypothetical protein